MVHPVDVIVGKRIRLRRSALSISQTELAERLGLTFQQIQKYERGSNRVSCSRLVELSKALDVPIVYFFEDTGSDRRQAIRPTRSQNHPGSTAPRFRISEDRKYARTAFGHCAHGKHGDGFR